MSLIQFNNDCCVQGLTFFSYVSLQLGLIQLLVSPLPCPGFASPLFVLLCLCSSLTQKAQTCHTQPLEPLSDKISIMIKSKSKQKLVRHLQL